MIQASSSTVIINFHPVDWTDYRSVVPWFVASPFGAVTKEYLHVSMTVTLNDDIDYTYSLTTEGVLVNYELPTPTARFSVTVPSFLDLTARIKESFVDGSHLSLCALLQVLLGRKHAGFYTCAGWVFLMTYGEIELSNGEYLNVSITTTELLRRLVMASNSKLGVVRM